MKLDEIHVGQRVNVADGTGRSTFCGVVRIKDGRLITVKSDAGVVRLVDCARLRAGGKA